MPGSSYCSPRARSSGAQSRPCIGVDKHTALDARKDLEMARQSRNGVNGHKRGKRGAPQTFAWKLYSILDSESPIVGWSPAGDSFTVYNDKDFAMHILTKNYRHGKFSSFQRQLNMYGFRKVTECSDRTYAHPLFRRDCPELLANVRRVNPGHKPKKSPSDSVEATDTTGAPDAPDAPDARAVGAVAGERDENEDDDGFGAETTGESEEGDEEAPAARKKRRPSEDRSSAGESLDSDKGEKAVSGGNEKSRLKRVTQGAAKVKLQTGVEGDAGSSSGSGSGSGDAPVAPEARPLETPRVSKRRQVKDVVERRAKVAKKVKAAAAPAVTPNVERSRQEEDVACGQTCPTSVDPRPPVPPLPPVPLKQRIRRPHEARPRQPGCASRDLMAPCSISSMGSSSPVYSVPSSPTIRMGASSAQLPMSLGPCSKSNATVAAKSVGGTRTAPDAVESIPWRGPEVVSPATASSVECPWPIGIIGESRASGVGPPAQVGRASNLCHGARIGPIAASNERGGAREKTPIESSSTWLDRALRFGLDLAQSPAAGCDLIVEPDDYGFADEGGAEAGVLADRAIGQARPNARTGIDARCGMQSESSPPASAALVTPPSASGSCGSVTTLPWELVDTTSTQWSRANSMNNCAASSFENAGHVYSGKCPKPVLAVGSSATLEKAAGETKPNGLLERSETVVWTQAGNSVGEDDGFQTKHNSAPSLWALTGCDTSSIDWALAESVDKEDAFLKVVEGLGENSAGNGTAGVGVEEAFGSMPPEVLAARVHEHHPQASSTMMTTSTAMVTPLSSLSSYSSEVTPTGAMLNTPRSLALDVTCGGGSSGTSTPITMTPTLSVYAADPALGTESEPWGFEPGDSRMPPYPCFLDR